MPMPPDPDKFLISVGDVVGMTKVLGLLALAVMAALSACATTTSPAAPQVASIGTSSAVPTGATTGSAATGRPQWRLDSTEAEVKALWMSYWACLGDHGHKMIDQRGTADMDSHTPADKAAEDACANKMPLEPDELDQKKNPHYLDEYHTYMTCLTSHDVAVHAIDPFGSGWTFDDGVTQKLTEDQRNKVDKDCQIQAFSQH